MAKKVIRAGTVLWAGGWRGRVAVLLALAMSLGMGSFLVRTVLAVHETGAFELEGNAVTDLPPAHDWDQVYADSLQNPHGATSGAKAISFTQELDLQATIFTGGGSKDPQDINNWAWKDGAGGLPDKDNLLDGFAARYSLPGTQPNGTCPNGTGDLNGNGVIDPNGVNGSKPEVDFNPAIPCEVLYFGSDRYDNSGDAQQGFWFLQNEVGLGTNSVGGGFGFTGKHKAGDMLIISDFSNGGTTSTITIYQWDPTCTATNKPDGGCGDANLRRLATSTAANCDTAAPNDAFCGIVNPANNTLAPWSFTDKSGFNTYLNGEFYEGGVNLSLLGLANECFATVASETRSSTSTTATLKDFVMGGFAKCSTGLTTTPKDGSGNDISADGLSIGTGSISVKDSATLTISGVASWTGSLKFYLCGPTSLSSAYVPCTTDGTLIDTKTVTNAAATVLSAAATITSAGKYCWRGEFTSGTAGVPNATDPDPAANPLPTNECFFVNPVVPSIPTTASAGVVLGNTVSDTAGLTGTANEPGTPTAINPTTPGGPAAGSITFSLYGPSATAICTDPVQNVVGNRVFQSSAVAVSGDAQYSSGTFTPTAAGTYYWVARYTGDSPNTLSVNGICGGTNETVVVSPKQPSIATSATAVVALGTAISDSATLTGGTAGAGGTITFKAYGPADASCSNTPAFTSSPVAVSGADNKTYGPVSFTPGTAGTYLWIASYSGDSNNLPVAGTCGATGETSLVVQTTMTTSQFSYPNDSAHITASGGGDLAGTVRFQAFTDSSCATTALYDSGEIDVTTGGAGTDKTFETSNTTHRVTGSGTVYWLVTFTSTNANHSSKTSSCGSEKTVFTVTQ